MVPIHQETLVGHDPMNHQPSLAMTFDQSRRVSSLIGCLAVMAMLCVVTATTWAQEIPTSSVIVNPQVQDDDCGCRNIAGGYPCRGGCQKCMVGVDCACACGAETRWRDMRPMAFDAYGPGGYAGPSRLAHLGQYRLRAGDQLQVVYLITRRQKAGAYRLTPGDEVLIESVSDEELTRGTLENGLVIQPDGTITVRMLGQVHASGMTVTVRVC